MENFSETRYFNLLAVGCAVSAGKDARTYVYSTGRYCNMYLVAVQKKI